MADEAAPEVEPPSGVPSKKYDQAFFIVLAAKGKEAWNAWRRDPANKDVRVTFKGIDFSEVPRDRIDFSGFEFGHHADFSGCKWRGVEWREIREDLKGFGPGRACFTSAAFGFAARFTGAAFGPRARFTGATFGEWAKFDGAVFGDAAYFDGATFDDWAHFTGAAFGDDAYFTGAAFGDDAYFDGAAFGNQATFTGAAFGDWARFDGAAFGNWAVFDETHFRGQVRLTGRSIEQWSRDLEARAEEADERGKQALIALKQRNEDSWKRSVSGPDRFLSVSFERARFDGEADFSGRSFKRAADFTQARFYFPPDFDPATKDARIDFTGTYIGFVPPGRLLHWTSDSKVPARLRAHRKIAEETKNHDLERDLYIEERKAERGVYLNQLLERDELDKKLRDVTEQKEHVWLEWRLQRRARNAHWLGLVAKRRKLRGLSPIASGSRSWASIGRLPIMAAALCGPPRGSSRACFSLTGVTMQSWRRSWRQLGRPKWTNISKRWACWRWATPCLSLARSPSTARSKNFSSARTATPLAFPFRRKAFRRL